MLLAGFKNLGPKVFPVQIRPISVYVEKQRIILRPIRYSSDVSKILCAYRIRRSWDPNVHIYLFLMNQIVYNTLHSFGFDLGACYKFLFNGHCVLIVLFPLLSHYFLPSRDSRHFRRLLPSGKLFFFELSCFGFLGLLTLFQI